MTTVTYHKDSKLCPVCGERFYRRLGKSPSHFRAQITCSRACGNVHAADPDAHRPVPEPDVQQSGRRMGEADWRHRAACRGMADDDDLFFPVGESGPALMQIAEAKTVCKRCPVVSECLTWALESGQDAGIWGGLSESERRTLKRRQARTRARTAS